MVSTIKSIPPSGQIQTLSLKYARTIVINLALVPIGGSGRRRRRHLSRAQRGGYAFLGGLCTRGHSLSKLYSIPPPLCRHICQYVAQSLEALSIKKGNGAHRGTLRGAELSRCRPIEEGSEESEDPLHERASREAS